VLDAAARRLTAVPLERAGVRLAQMGARPLALTGVGWLAGVGACVAIVVDAWTVALVLWLLNRLLDGLDGAVARQTGPTDLGGFLDIVADFSIYGGFVLAVAISVPEARLACMFLLVSYYVSGTAFLALSSLLERRRTAGIDPELHRDERSLRFVGGIAEGTETVIAYVLFTLFPEHAELIAWVFTATVALTALQRVAEGIIVLRTTSHQESV